MKQKIGKTSYKWHTVFNISALVGGVFFASSLLPSIAAAPASHKTWQLPISLTAKPKPSSNQSSNPRPKSQTNQSSGSIPPRTAAAPPAQTVATIPPHDAATDKRQGNKIVTQSGATYPIIRYKPLALPNDPLANQWWVAPNSMSTVWDMAPGAQQTKIAVIDTGFALQHEDLVNRWAVNSGEMGPTTVESPTPPNCTSRGLPLDKSCNGLDNDGNGYINDWRGWDFAGNDNTPQAGDLNPDGTSTVHGTTTAGIIGAEYNNGKGTAGVNRYSTILPLQALDDNGYGDTFTVGKAVYYAADQKADVISISLGATTPDDYLRGAIQYAMSKGSVVVASAGNDGCDCLSYPANYPEVIAVGASTPSGTRASFSSYGANLDLLAPGQSMTAPYWTKLNGVNAYANNLAGTSYSAPFVSALLGLARSYQPTASWDEIVGSMLENTDRRDLVYKSPRADDMGFGYTRANTMMQRVVTPLALPQRISFDQNMIGTQRAYQCPSGVLPATPIYELLNGSTQHFTASSYQMALYAASGYTARPAFYGCIGLPGDTASQVRSLNIGQEVYNGVWPH